jgi:hypothetical protein
MTDVNAPSAVQYGRCGSCDEIKHVAPDGLLHDHNSYDTSGTAPVAIRCPGSGTRPVDLGAECRVDLLR